MQTEIIENNWEEGSFKDGVIGHVFARDVNADRTGAWAREFRYE